MKKIFVCFLVFATFQAFAESRLDTLYNWSSDIEMNQEQLGKVKSNLNEAVKESELSSETARKNKGLYKKFIQNLKDLAKDVKYSGSKKKRIKKLREQLAQIRSFLETSNEVQKNLEKQATEAYLAFDFSLRANEELDEVKRDRQEKAEFLKEAIAEAEKEKSKVLICISNIMNKKGMFDGFKLYHLLFKFSFTKMEEYEEFGKIIVHMRNPGNNYGGDRWRETRRSPLKLNEVEKNVFSFILRGRNAFRFPEDNLLLRVDLKKGMSTFRLRDMYSREVKKEFELPELKSCIIEG